MSGVETSPSLLIRIRDPQDSLSWELFVQAYTPIVYRYLTTRGLQSADAADVAQDTLLEVANGIQRFQYDPKVGRFRDWLALITKRQLYRFWNRHKPVEEWVEPPANSGLDAEWIDVFQRELLNTAIERVKQQVEPATWQAFSSTWIEDIPAATVAEKLQMPIDLVYSAKARFLKRLEAEIRMLGDDNVSIGTQFKSNVP